MAVSTMLSLPVQIARYFVSRAFHAALKMVCRADQLGVLSWALRQSNTIKQDAHSWK